MIKCEKDRNEFQMLQKMERNNENLGNASDCNNGTMESAVFVGKKNYLNNCQSIAITTDLTFKQNFDISTRLVFYKMRSLDWKPFVVKIMKELSIFNAQR